MKTSTPLIVRRVFLCPFPADQHFPASLPNKSRDCVAHLLCSNTVMGSTGTCRARFRVIPGLRVIPEDSFAIKQSPSLMACAVSDGGLSPVCVLSPKNNQTSPLLMACAVGDGVSRRLRSQAACQPFPGRGCKCFAMSPTLPY